jgi:hypothetical protein
MFLQTDSRRIAQSVQKGVASVEAAVHVGVYASPSAVIPIDSTNLADSGTPVACIPRNPVANLPAVVPRPFLSPAVDAVGVCVSNWLPRACGCRHSRRRRRRAGASLDRWPAIQDRLLLQDIGQAPDGAQPRPEQRPSPDAVLEPAAPKRWDRPSTAAGRAPHPTHRRDNSAASAISLPGLPRSPLGEHVDAAQLLEDDPETVPTVRAA